MDIMLDLETYGNGHNAAIRSIGACLFDPKAGKWSSPMSPVGTFHKGVDLAASRSPGEVDFGTVDWWMVQGDTARLALMDLDMWPLEDVISRFTCWIMNNVGSKPKLWSNGPLFDERILREAYTRHDERFPIHYRESRCFRTLVSTAKAKGLQWKHHDEVGNVQKHDALSDAVRQAKTVIEAYRLLGVK